PGEGARVMATILFTDIVDSTVHARKEGDAAWKHTVTMRRSPKPARGCGARLSGAGRGWRGVDSISLQGGRFHCTTEITVVRGG
ncbi:MAG: hypothetical protein ACRDWY_18880, partial [Actinomycetes bacterium]